jgi:hypothetical protein
MAKDKDAIKNDASAEEIPKEQLASNARLAMIEQIGQQADARKMEEVREQGGEFKIEDPAEESASEDKKEAETKTETETKDEELVEIKIDGKTQKVPLSELIEEGKVARQKKGAADKRLREAAEEKARLKKEREEFEEERRRLSEETPPGKDTDGETLETLIAERREKYKAYKDIEGLGDDDEEWEALMAYEEASDKVKAHKERRTEKPSEATEDKEQESEPDEYEDIRFRFNRLPEDGGFSDISSNEKWLGRTQEVLQEMFEEGKSDREWETYKEAGEKVREEIIAEMTSREDLEERKAKKKSIDNLKTASATQTSDEEEELTLAQSRAMAVQEMIKEREERQLGHGRG